MTEQRTSSDDSQTPPGLEPGSLAASVAHAAAVVLGIHQRDADGRCMRPGCDHPCVVAAHAEKWQRLARECTDLRALREAENWLYLWVMLHTGQDET